jgi:hypothetical protein
MTGTHRHTQPFVEKESHEKFSPTGLSFPHLFLLSNWDYRLELPHPVINEKLLAR